MRAGLGPGKGAVSSSSEDTIRRLNAQHAATRALVAARDVPEAFGRIVREVAENLGWDVGVAWYGPPDAGELSVAALWSRDPDSAFARATRALRIGRGEGLPGRVWESGRAAWIADVAGEADFPRAAAAAEAGIRSAFAFPIPSDHHIAGVLEFFSAAPAEPDPVLLATMAAIGGQIGLFLSRRQAEAELREQVARYRLITQTASDVILVIDAASTIRHVNPAVRRVFGWSPEELVGRPLGMLLPPEERDRQLADLHDLTRAGKGRASWSGRQLPALRRDGSVVPVEMSLGTFELDGERLYTGILRDISDRLAEQQKLEETAAELEATVEELEEQRAAAEAAREDALLAARWSTFLAEAGRALATAIDRDETLRMVAHLAVPAIADICIIDILQEDATIGRVEVVHSEDVDAALAREYQHRYPPSPAGQIGVPEVIRTGEPGFYRTVRDVDLRAFARDETQLAWLRQLHLRSLMVVPLVARGRTLGAITLATSGSGRSYDLNDLTTVEGLANRAALAIDNAELYEQALSANRAKANFLAIMSHELRTPLTAIMGYTDILQAGIAGSLTDRQREYLERVMVSARHLLRLIDEILTYSRLEVGRERNRYQRVALRQFTENAANLVRPAMLQKRLDFRIEAPPDDVYAETDPEKLRQVLLDLLFNAAKFTPAGTVVLRVRAERGTVYLEVEDTGIGIKPEELGRIFEPFWQAEEAMTRREGGTGMGLSVALRLTRLLGGDIDVRSTPERGTTVTVRIPQHAPASSQSGSAAA